MSRIRLAPSTIASARALAVAHAGAHDPAGPPGKERCYGVVEVGQNDCASLSGSHDCAGQARKDRAIDEWTYLPAGTCRKLGGFSAAEARRKLAQPQSRGVETRHGAADMLERIAAIVRPTLVALAAAGAAAATAPDVRLGPFDLGRGPEPAAPWHVIGFPFQDKPLSRFDVVEVDAQRVLRVEAEDSYGILLHPLAGSNGATHLSWRWRVDLPNERADLRQRSGDDIAAQVCVGFDLPIDAVPFVDRQLLRITRLAIKDHVPAATVCYVWDSHLPTGTALDSAFTRRIRLIVLRGAGTAPATWHTESRDVAADFLRLFGDEAKEVPPIVGVAVAADSDNTHAHTLAYVADLTLKR